MGTLKLILFMPLIFILSCSQTTPSNTRSEPNEKVVAERSPLGKAERTDGATIDFDAVAEDSIVIVFASDTCATCAEEAKYWTGIFKSALPKNIYFVHFLIGGSIEDATDWKNYYKVNWDVVIESEDRLFKKYCPAIRTPCFLILNKQTNQILQTYEVLQKTAIEEITGPWEF